MDTVDAAFAATPRGDFLPRALRDRAAHDGPVEIGHDQANSQPRTVAAMLRLLGQELVPELVEFGATNLATTDRPWAPPRRGRCPKSWSSSSPTVGVW